MAGQYLPPVITRLTADIGDFVQGMANAKAAQDAFRGSVKDTNTELGKQATLLAVINPAITSMTTRSGSAAAAQGRLSAAIKDTNGALYRQQAALAAAGFAGLGAAAAGAGGTAFIGGWGWMANPQVWHWIIAGGAEILAVTIPALIALGAAAAVAMEGVANLDSHMEATYTATEATSRMFGVTFGGAIGLARGQLQKAQTAADPSIYGMLGSAIKTVNEHFGTLAQTGLQVIQVMQTFSAKVAADFQPGGALGSSVDSLLSHMVSDVTDIGKVFGNLGNSLLAFGSQMPGLAEVLLKLLANTTGWLAELIDLSARLSVHGVGVLTVVMAYEEFNRWGGLVAVTLGRIGLASNVANGGLATGAFSFARFSGILRGIYSIVPNVIGGLGNLVAKVGAKGAGGAVNDFADAIGMGVSSLSDWQLVLGTVAAVGLGFFIDKLLTAQSAAQKLAAAMQNNVLSQSNVNAGIVAASNIAVLGNQASVAAKQVTALSTATHQIYGAGPGHGGVDYTTGARLGAAAAAVQTYSAALVQQEQDQLNVNQGAHWIAQTIGTSLYGALILADNANVKLANGIMGTNHQMSVAQLQIISLVDGYRAMGQSSGEVGQDMTALAIQSGLAGTQVSKLNSAWDDFMTNMTGGTSGLGGFVQSIKNIGNVVATSSQNLGQAANINLNPTQFAQALTTFGNLGSQAWQNFGQIVGSTAPQVIDWLRTAGAMGVIQAPQFSRAVLGMVSSLTQFAAKSPAAQADLLALAQQADPNIKTWGQLTAAIKNGNININDTAKAVENATVKMGDMAQVAQNLGNVMNANLLSTMSNATIAAAGVGAATQKYMNDLMGTGVAVSKTAGDRAALLQDLEKLGYSAQQAAQFIQILQGQIDGLHGKTITITTIMQAISGSSAAKTSPGSVHGITGPGGGMGAAMSFTGGSEPAVHEVNVYLDGRKIYRAVQGQAVNAQRRNGTNGLSRRSR